MTHCVSRGVAGFVLKGCAELNRRGVLVDSVLLFLLRIGGSVCL